MWMYAIKIKNLKSKSLENIRKTSKKPLIFRVEHIRNISTTGFKNKSAVFGKAWRWCWVLKSMSGEKLEWKKRAHATFLQRIWPEIWIGSECMSRAEQTFTGPSPDISFFVPGIGNLNRRGVVASGGNLCSSLHNILELSTTRKPVKREKQVRATAKVSRWSLRGMDNKAEIAPAVKWILRLPIMCLSDFTWFFCSAGKLCREITHQILRKPRDSLLLQLQPCCRCRERIISKHWQLPSRVSPSLLVYVLLIVSGCFVTKCISCRLTPPLLDVSSLQSLWQGMIYLAMALLKGERLFCLVLASETFPKFRPNRFQKRCVSIWSVDVPER